MSDEQISLLSTASSEDSRAKISAWRDAVRDWLESGADSGTNSIVSLMNLLPVGFASNKFLVCYPLTGDEILPSSFEGWGNAGMGGPSACLTLKISESHSAAVAFLLSDVLEGSAHQKYYLSPKACSGILRRAQKRGRELPEELYLALLAVAKRETEPEEPPSSEDPETGSLDP
jgi:hypothetical protein